MTLPETFASVPSAPAPARDGELVARVRAGDAEAFETLYLAHHAALWTYAYGLVRSEAVAEELVQDVFLSLWARRTQWVVTTTAAAWLYGAVRNRALNHRRHERTVTRTHDGVDAPSVAGATMAMPGPDAQACVEAAELETTAEHAIAHLSGRCRQALTLRWKHEMSPAEIGEVLGATPGAVRVLLTRGRQELARLIGRARP